MDIVIPLPEGVKLILIGAPLLLFGIAALLRGRRFRERWLPPILVSLICAAAYVVVMRPMRFSWNDGGIVDGSFLGDRTIPWSSIREAQLIPNYCATDFRPVRRTSGTAYHGYAGGWFQLANGSRMRVFLAPGTADALLVTTTDASYLYAPPHFEQFRAAVEQHVGRR